MKEFSEVFVEKILNNEKYREPIIKEREDSIKSSIERGKSGREILKRLLLVKVTKGY